MKLMISISYKQHKGRNSRLPQLLLQLYVHAAAAAAAASAAVAAATAAVAARPL